MAERGADEPLESRRVEPRDGALGPAPSAASQVQTRSRFARATAALAGATRYQTRPARSASQMSGRSGDA